ncbi:MAG: quinone-dependent dihydroorotate dehydrogenase [Ottowia sp.]|nr:quinone-dependent dihydroorotate dehydrogenase [Ottowia sp.]
MLNQMYPLMRRFLFMLDAETTHHFTLKTIKWLHRHGLEKIYSTASSSHAIGARILTEGTGRHMALANKKKLPSPRTLMGITFPNAVGLAAGLDKDGAYIDALAVMGFGFVEVGTVTPRPQRGNALPRLFRLPQAHALINRMGFNNGGVEAFIANVRASHFAAQGGILGLNIGKNADTPVERAAEDYLYCLDRVYTHASYVVINISSPNTQHLRSLQNETALDALLTLLRERQQRLADQHQRYVPMLLKIAPDLDAMQIQVIATALLRHKMDGVIATNTTLSRENVKGMQYAEESGGLSGAPLLSTANWVVRQLRVALGNEFPIIGAGGILSAQDAISKQDAGADIVQIYTGLIYQGPKLVSDCIHALT